MKDLIKAVKSKKYSLYDYISNNYYNLTKEELKEIIKEIDYAIYKNYGEEITIKIENEALDEIAQNIELYED